MFRALRYLEKLSTIIRFPGERHDLSRSGKPAHRVERLQKAGPRNAASFDSDSVSLDIRLAPANEPLASGCESHFALGRDHCEGEFGAAPLSSEIAHTRDAGCRAPRPIGRAPTPDPLPTSGQLAVRKRLIMLESRGAK
jgi:hypothetical protein